jgi:Family of unknown function (DUF6476)
MNEAPIQQPEAKHLRFLRILVTILTTTMILGVLTIVGLLVIRFTGERPRLVVPDAIVLPSGVRATAFTQGADWYAVVTDQNQILIYDAATNALIKRVDVRGE